MALLTPANMRLLTDKLAWMYRDWKSAFGVASGDPVAGTYRFLADKALAVLTTTADDYFPQKEISDSVYSCLTTAVPVSLMATKIIGAAFNAILSHCGTQGKAVSTTITDLSTYLTYYNGGSGGVAYANMLHPVFGDMYFDLKAARLPAAGLFHPAIQPVFDPSVSANGMGARSVGASFGAGTAYTNLYSEPVALLEVVEAFENGGAAPSVTVTGVDNTGATLSWTAALSDNNPTADLSVTLSGAVTAMSRSTVTLSSATGIIAGSVITVGSGLTTEVTVVEAVSSNDITAVFKYAHASGEAVTAKRTVLLTPGTANRRIRSVTGITISIQDHTAGRVRVVGKQERMPSPAIS